MAGAANLVSAALNGGLVGNPIAVARTQPYGCDVKVCSCLGLRERVRSCAKERPGRPMQGGRAVDTFSRPCLRRGSSAPRRAARPGQRHGAHQLLAPHAMRLVRVRALPALQIFEVRLVVPLTPPCVPRTGVCSLPPLAACPNSVARRSRLRLATAGLRQLRTRPSLRRTRARPANARHFGAVRHRAAKHVVRCVPRLRASCARKRPSPPTREVRWCGRGRAAAVVGRAAARPATAAPTG